VGCGKNLRVAARLCDCAMEAITMIPIAWQEGSDSERSTD